MKNFHADKSEPLAPCHQPFMARYSFLRQQGGWAMLLVLLTLVALNTRSAIPLDETRYLAVAWEMWSRNDFWVPFLNGAPYSHKPPLLFWLIDAGWQVLGPNTWWPRLIAPLLAWLNIWMTWRLATRLWPDHPGIRLYAPWVLISMLIWLIYAQALMFDMLVATCALLGLNAIAHGALSNAPSSRWWLGFGASIGLGLLAKGPAILVHVLPVALLAPWWSPVSHLKRWYAHTILALLFGIALALLWAIPAGQMGGPAYNQAIFWGQTAHRVVNSFAHQLPFWWYLAALPLLLFPWLTWPSLLTQMAGHIRHGLHDTGVRFTLVWGGGALLVFSFISGKQPHYILPEAPAFALLIAYALTQQKERPVRALVPAVCLIALGGWLTWKIAFQQQDMSAPRELSALSVWAGSGFVLAGMSFLLRLTPIQRVYGTAITMVSLVLWTLLVAFKPLAPAFDMTPVAQELHRLEQEGRAIAHLGKYHGQFHFAGKLHRPIEVVFSEADLPRWIAQHPQGVVILYGKEKRSALFSQAYRETHVGIFSAPHALALLKLQPPAPQQFPVNDSE